MERKFWYWSKFDFYLDGKYQFSTNGYNSEHVIRRAQEKGYWNPEFLVRRDKVLDRRNKIAA